MSQMTKKNLISKTRLLAPMVALPCCSRRPLTPRLPASTGPTFNLTASPPTSASRTEQMIYSWGYGCNGRRAGYRCPQPCPTRNLPLNAGPGPDAHRDGRTDRSRVTLTNDLPAAAGNTSILFPGFTVTTAGGVAGLLTQEAAPGGTVTYTFTPSSPGTRAYYSGTQGDLQVEMGLYGAIIVLPANVPSDCTSGLARLESWRHSTIGEKRFPAGALPPTTIPRPAMTASICSSSPRSIPTIHQPGTSSRLRHSGDCSGRCRQLHAQCGDRALPSGVFHDQRPLHAGRHGPELCRWSIHTSLTTAIRTCIRANRCCCASSAKAGGSIRSTSTATMCACWGATET